MPSSRFQLTKCRSCSDCVMVGLNRICAIIQVCTDQLLNVDCVRIMQCWLIYVRVVPSFQAVANNSMCSVLMLVGYTVSSCIFCYIRNWNSRDPLQELG